MHLISISYREYPNTDKYWELQKCYFEEVNLLVGRNATGKSRTLNVIAGLANLITGKTPQIYESAHYDVVLDVEGRLIEFALDIENKQVVNECVKVDGQEKLKRSADGSGTLVFEAAQQTLEFRSEPGKLAVVQKQDVLQHPYLADILNWARFVKFYPFSTDFGRSNLLTLEQGRSITGESAAEVKTWGDENVLATYIEAFTKYGSAFDQAIMEDMRLLGFDLVDVGAEAINIVANDTVFSLFVIEHDVGSKIFQLMISQGMFRALALTISLNKCLFDGGKQIIIVDDVGEGLDYRRAGAVVDYLINKSKSGKCQLFMSTNDEFTMNHVPLDHWSLLQRKGHVVSARTAKNTPEEFKKFKFMGLNNFDFFTSQIGK